MVNGGLCWCVELSWFCDQDPWQISQRAEQILEVNGGFFQPAPCLRTAEGSSCYIPAAELNMSNWLFYRHECPMHIVFPLGFPMKCLLLQKWMAKLIWMPIQLPSKFRVRNYQRHRRAASGINIQRFGSASAESASKTILDQHRE